MFEGRLKILLAILLVFVLVLLARAMQLQVIERDYWSRQAANTLRTEQLVETTRGSIIDRNGNILAADEPCISACVDYRAIPQEADKAWVNELALARLKQRPQQFQEYKRADTKAREAILAPDVAFVRGQIADMWEKLAVMSNQSREQLDALRQAICDRVERRRVSARRQKLSKILRERAPKAPPSWLPKWLAGDQPTTGPADDSEAAQTELVGEIKIREETSAHVIVEAIDTRTQNELEKNADQYPGLKLLPTVHRVYPYGDVAAHVIGHLGKVTGEDLKQLNPDLADSSDERKTYKPNDAIGREGLEALGEPTLRGVRGSEIYDDVTERPIPGDSTSPRPGSNLRVTMDVELQQEIQDLFSRVQVPYDNAKPPHCDPVPMHGAAVVIEIASGDVLALVSNPGYNLNEFDKRYSTLATDQLDRPLLNRATQSTLEPGSTVKPVVGAGAITQGLLGVNEGIECTGFLVIGGTRYSVGKCWTVSVARANNLSDAEASHHQIPTLAPHRGHDGNGDGFLTYPEALERSCNVFFETVADRLKIEGLSYWMERFGLGRPTGIGIAERRGQLPREYVGPNTQFATWTAGIGQGSVLVTPLQMANVAATIARRGIWVRPNLVDAGQNLFRYRPKGVPGDDPIWGEIPSQIDLKISPAAINAAILGMTNVVNADAGTGKQAHRDDMTIAGKTGTAQAAKFWVRRTDGQGNFIVEGQDANGKDKYEMEPLEPSTHEHPNNEHPWYRASDEKGEKLNHAWFIGFAPAEHPQYAISVMVEYGGGGGGAVAGPIASDILEALVRHGYLRGQKANRAIDE